MTSGLITVTRGAGLAQGADLALGDRAAAGDDDAPFGQREGDRETPRVLSARRRGLRVITTNPPTDAIPSPCVRPSSVRSSPRSSRSRDSATARLWDNSETVYGEVAREILLTHDWVVMHLNGAAWFVQPPLYLLDRGAVRQGVRRRRPSRCGCRRRSPRSRWAAPLGYATARVAGTRAGTVAAIVLSTSLMQAIVGRLAIMDALLDLCVVIAILCWFRALQPHRQAEDARRRAIAFLCGTVGAGAAGRWPRDRSHR